MDKVHETNVWLVSYNPKLDILEILWKDQGEIELDNDEFQEHLLLHVAFINKFKVKGFRVDCRQYHVIMNVETQMWHDKVIAPEYVKAGIKKIAFIMPTGFIEALSIQQAFEEENAKDLSVKYFNDEFESEAWLLA